MKKTSRRKLSKKKIKEIKIAIAVLVLMLTVVTAATVLILSRNNIESDLSEQPEVAADTELPYTTTMRIVITDSDGSIYWNQVDVYDQTGNYYTSYAASSYETGEMITLSAGDINGISSGSLVLGYSDGTLSNGYPDTVELWVMDQGIVVVNQLDIEDYIKRVVPSEMPQSYGTEALKAQAVCARTYAYKHSNKYAYPAVNGQMDDTVSFQVYNQSNGTTETNSAVEATAGMIIVDQTMAEPIDALYYSTSCGFSQTGLIMGDDMDTSVLTGVYIGNSDASPEALLQNLDFDTYLTQMDENAYEKDEKYYRWNANLDLTGNRNALVAELIDLSADDEAVDCTEKFYETLVSNELSVGNLQDITISERSETGAVTCLTFVFDEGSISVLGQLNVRYALATLTDDINLNDGSQVEAAILPSAIISIQNNNGTYTVYGGGYGHGCGMSQNGAKLLAGMGLDYSEILNYFYKSVEILSY